MAQKTCPNCGTQQPEEYLFCAECGSKLPEKAPEPVAAVEQPSTEQPPVVKPAASASQPPQAPVQPPQPAPAPRPVATPRQAIRGVQWTLVHLSRAGGTNEPYPVPQEGFDVGTKGCAINFPDDRTMSSRHLFVTPAENGLKVEDAGSVNGLFLKIKSDHILADGDIFVCGDSVFRFSNEIASTASDDFKLYAAADEACPAGTITKILAGGIDGPVYPIGRRAVVIGRESADVSCPEDRYMSRVHASVEPVSSGLALKDKQSRNGTYIKTGGAIVVRDGDVVLIGRQLLKIEARSL